MTAGADRDRHLFPLSAATLLVWVVIVQSVGVGVTAYTGEVAVESWLLYQTPLRDPWLTLVADTTAWGCLAGAVAGYTGYRAGWVWVALWFTVEALASTFVEVGAFMELTLPAHAVRIAAPLALVFAAESSTREMRIGRGLLWVLMVATGLTFAAHGIEAAAAHATFVDYLVVFTGTLGFDPTQQTLEVALLVIGVIDIGVALVALTGRRWRHVYAYMAFWGTIAAASRVVHSGLYGMSDTLIRAANGGVPAAIFLYVWRNLESTDS